MSRARNRNDQSQEFTLTARAHRLKRGAVSALESAARSLFSERPERVLNERESFESAATYAVLGEAGNLELSYGQVDDLATTAERLALTRASDIPDPFRRVWICGAGGERKRGVVLRREPNQIAVFCPPSRDSFLTTGDNLFLEYRGFEDGARLELELRDSVLLPNALVLHLTRPSAGAIGRSQVRIDVQFAGTLRVALEGAPSNASAADLTLWPVKVLDISSGGVRIASEFPESSGREVELELDLPDETGPRIRLPAVLRWNRVDEHGRRTQGLQFGAVKPEDQRHYLRFLSRFVDEDELAESLASMDTIPQQNPAPAFEPERSEQDAPDPIGVSDPQAAPRGRAALLDELNAVRRSVLEVEVDLLGRLRDEEPLEDVLAAEREALGQILPGLSEHIDGYLST